VRSSLLLEGRRSQMEKMSEKVRRISIVGNDGAVENDKHRCDTVNKW